jgi:ATP-binding cassette, subfamily A (ABC1), member 3
MTFQLPTESASQFKDFFNQLDQNLDRLGIRSYGVGITTLEEVFLRIAKDDKEEAEEPDSPNQLLRPQSNKNQDLEEYSITEQHETGALNVFMLNLKALLKKKLLLQVRD